MPPPCANPGPCDYKPAERDACGCPMGCGELVCPPSSTPDPCADVRCVVEDPGCGAGQVARPINEECCAPLECFTDCRLVRCGGQPTCKDNEKPTLLPRGKWDCCDTYECTTVRECS